MEIPDAAGTPSRGQDRRCSSPAAKTSAACSPARRGRVREKVTPAGPGRRPPRRVIERLT
jgi:hypothetical protein